MKKRIRVVCILCCLFLTNPIIVLAHPGRTDSNGCHTCRTNCEKWGLRYGQYHCHNKKSNSSSSGNQYYNYHGGSSSNSSDNQKNQVTEPPPVPKSSDNTLKAVSIEGENIEVAEEMFYNTKNEEIKISTQTNDAKASVYVDNSSLEIGKNTIVIKVTAENGDVKKYNLIVTREKLSSNTNIKIIAYGEEISLSSQKEKARIGVPADTQNLYYSYELEDPNSTVTIEESKNSNSKKYKIYLTVTAEDGTTSKYKLTFHRVMSKEEKRRLLLGILITSGVIGIGRYIIKNKKKKSYFQQKTVDKLNN